MSVAGKEMSDKIGYKVRENHLHAIPLAWNYQLKHPGAKSVSQSGLPCSSFSDWLTPLVSGYFLLLGAPDLGCECASLKRSSYGQCVQKKRASLCLQLNFGNFHIPILM